MEMNIRVPEVWQPLFDKSVKERRHVALTGRSTGKTEAMARKVFKECEEQQQSFVIFRDREKYIKKNIYRTMERVARKIGVYHKYRWPKAPPYSIVSKNGNYSIDFFGIEDDPDKVKGYEPQNNTLCGAWFEEFGSITDITTINSVSETIARFMHINSYWLYSGNPPREANAWPRVWLNKIKTMPGYIVYEPTFADIWHLLTEQNKSQIINAYLIDPDEWRKSYLGEPANMDGLVYNNLRADEHLIDKMQQFDETIVGWALGVDIAIANDKTAAVLILKLANGRLITQKEFVHDPKSGRRIKLTMDKQAELIEKIYRKIVDDGLIMGGKKTKLGGLPHKIVVDTQDFGLTQMLQDRDLPAIKVKKKNVVTDIERGRSLIDRFMMYIVEEECETLLYEMEHLTWRDQAKSLKLKVDTYGTVIRQQHVNGEDDVENAWRYAHSWLTQGQRPTFRLDPLKEFSYKRELEIMALNDIEKERGMERNA